MASAGDRQKLVEDKKQELLRRIAEKKKTSQTQQVAVPSTSGSSSNNIPSKGPLFVNDGNFLARFQAMQQQSKATTTTTSVDSRPAVTMKLTTVKKATQVKPVSTRLDVFEAPEDDDINGNFISVTVDHHSQPRNPASNIWCNFESSRSVLENVLMSGIIKFPHQKTKTYLMLLRF